METTLQLCKRQWKELQFFIDIFEVLLQVKPDTYQFLKDKWRIGVQNTEQDTFHVL